MKKYTLFFLTLILTVFELHTAHACRYTVCEIGFAEFNIDHYRLILFRDKDVNDEMAAVFKRTAYGALLDANVKSEIMDVGQNSQDTTINLYRQYKKAGTPLALLVAPDGKAFPFYMAGKMPQFGESVWQVLQAAVTSPVRKQILDHIIDSFAVVLFIEGDDAAENDRILAQLKAAMEDITGVQKSMPKPFEQPPYLIVMHRDRIKTEAVLLWSLGWKKDLEGQPAAAILYGRGRMMGRLLSGALLRREYAYNLLTIVGADCECGLDRSWILGSMMPLRWDRSSRKAVVKWHSFDAENPSVKAEMSQILSISPDKSAKAGTNSLYGYTENAINIIKSYEAKQQPSPAVASVEKMKTEIIETDNTGLSSRLYWIIGLIIAANLLVLAIIMIKRRR